MSLRETFENIMAADAPQTTGHTPESDRRTIVAAIRIEIMQTRAAGALETAARIVAALESLGFQIVRKAR